tara:strand:+ start:1048 stop:2325 length:1278 start_codon:yes stop_codon:yes gene_type:complete
MEETITYNGDVVNYSDVKEEIGSGDIVQCSESDGDYYDIDECVYIEGDWYHLENDDGEYFAYCEDVGAYRLITDAIFSDLMGEWTSSENSVETHCGSYATSDWLGDNDYVCLDDGQYEGEWVHIDDSIHCQDIDGYVHIDEGHYSDRAGEWYYDQSAMPSESEDYEIADYHDSPPMIDRSFGCDFRIGFEIEKVSFDGLEDVGDEVGWFKLFKGFETDSSCGVEAITNLLPLSPLRSKHRKEVFEWIDLAQDIINCDTNSDCGGHITISRRGVAANDLLENIKPYLAILYALYRYRLKNTYSANNKECKKNIYGGYQAIQVKKGLGAIECRLVSRVDNTVQLKNRYDIMYFIMLYGKNHPGSLSKRVHSKFIKDITPTLNRMYKTTTMVEHIKELYLDFKAYLTKTNNPVSSSIVEFINPSNDNE